MFGRGTLESTHAGAGAGLRAEAHGKLLTFERKVSMKSYGIGYGTARPFSFFFVPGSPHVTLHRMETGTLFVPGSPHVTLCRMETGTLFVPV